MAHFKIEVMDEHGNMVESRYVELSALTVEQALHSKMIRQMKQEARAQRLGFRVKREDES